MRLIDADKLMEDFRNTITERSDTYDWLNMIYRQPTAYDVDKVVEQIRNISVLSRPVGWTQKYELIKLNEAIEIIKLGGKTE